jgi:hypothetical protein
MFLFSVRATKRHYDIIHIYSDFYRVVSFEDAAMFCCVEVTSRRIDSERHKQCVPRAMSATQLSRTDPA